MGVIDGGSSIVSECQFLDFFYFLFKKILEEYSYCIYITFLIRLCVCVHLGWFHSFAPMNTAVNVGMQLSFWYVDLTFESIPGSGIQLAVLIYGRLCLSYLLTSIGKQTFCDLIIILSDFYSACTYSQFLLNNSEHYK